MRIKTKYINHITFQGKKQTSEKQLLKSFKILQKISNKNSTKILQLATIFSTPIFKLHKLKLKKKKKKTLKEIPGFIKNKNSRISLAAKFILFNVRQNINFYLPQKFVKEILTTSKENSPSIILKEELQKSILTKKHYFMYYRWN